MDRWPGTRRPFPPRRSDRSVSLRSAQLALAREYGYAGWQDLIAEASTRSGSGLEWAVAEADRLIHDDDTERLRHLLPNTRHHCRGEPTQKAAACSEWRRGPMAMPRPAAGTVVHARCVRGAADRGRRSRGAHRSAKHPSIARQRAARAVSAERLLPRTLTFSAALGDLDAVRTAPDEHGHEATVVALIPLINGAFVRACLFHHERVALFLLERSIARDPELGRKVDGRVGRLAFVKSLIDTQPENVREIAGHATPPDCGRCSS